MHVHDFNATILHLMGIDHERLTFYHNGIERRLTDTQDVMLALSDKVDAWERTQRDEAPA